MTALARIVTLVLILTATARAAEQPPKVRRFAFLAGANDGGAGRTRLRYATSDARAVSRVLTEMGGVRNSDLVFADEPDRAEFLRQLDRMRDNIAAARTSDVRTVLIFYYSGHSDEDGLLLRGERLPYPELRARIEQIPADVRVAVLDSCASGALTRGKGGVFRPPFMADDSVKLKGHAFLTSSAANEVAQESDRIAASFFTHFLVSGLRGAADSNRDRQVTFFEAYQFAAQETLARTERTRGGPQHAAYDIQLNGIGDLVMTNVRGTSAGLVLSGDLQGFISVREPDQRLVAELRKVAGHPVELGLEPGKYLVTMAGPESVFEAAVELREGQRAEVGKLQFRLATSLEVARARGNDPTILAAPLSPPPPERTVPFSLGILPMPSSGPPERVVKNVSINLVADRAAQVRGLQLSIGINWADEELRGLQAAVGANISGGPVSGLQAAVGGNAARGDLHGLQAGVGLNMALANMFGLQAAAGANYVQGNLVGFQSSSGINLGMRDVRGVQAAAGANWVGGEMTGAQLAAGFNGAGVVRGTQVGVVNYAGDVAGAQVGIVNVAKVSRGLQLGLINISDEDHGVPIGLISYARRNGMLHLQVFGTETSPANLALKVGGRSIYNTFVFGVRPGREGNRFTTGLGLGARARFDRRFLSFLDTEVAASSFSHDLSQDNGLLILSSLRLIGGWQLARHFSVVAGPTLNVLVRKRAQDTDVAPSALESVLHDGDTNVSIYPGLVLGMEL
jgi:hypothetical protein